MVASAGVKGWVWGMGATLAVGFIGVLALQGERPEPGFARFKPAGLTADWPVQQVISVEVSTATHRRLFDRGPGSGWRLEATDDATTEADLAERIETGLTLLHNSAPERTHLTSEQLEEFGLEPPRLTVTARAINGASIAVDAGLCRRRVGTGCGGAMIRTWRIPLIFCSLAIVLLPAEVGAHVTATGLAVVAVSGREVSYPLDRGTLGVAGGGIAVAGAGNGRVPSGSRTARQGDLPNGCGPRRRSAVPAWSDRHPGCRRRPQGASRLLLALPGRTRPSRA